MKCFVEYRSNHRYNKSLYMQMCLYDPNKISKGHFVPRVGTMSYLEFSLLNKRPMWATVAHLSTMNASKIWHQNGTKTSGPKGHITCTWVQCATFLKDQPGWPFLFTDWPKKRKLGREFWDLGSCQLSLNSVQWFWRKSRLISAN